MRATTILGTGAVALVALLPLTSCGGGHHESDDCRTIRLATANAMAKGWEDDVKAGTDYLSSNCAD